MLALVEISEFHFPKVRPQEVDAAMEEAVRKLGYLIPDASYIRWLR
jgi:hypothetical protein